MLMKLSCVCRQTCSVIGGLNCFSTEVLQEFANKAVQLFGDAHNVSVASLSSIGAVLGQLINMALIHSQKKRKRRPYRHSP